MVNTKPLPFDVDAIKAQFDLTITQSALRNDEINFGTCILKPHVSSIVDHIERIVTENLAKKQLPSKPLKVLARLSCFASNSSQQCEKIIRLLTSYLVKNRKQSEEIEINILDSINNLLKQVRTVSDFICPLARLFSVVKNRMSRVELCKVILIFCFYSTVYYSYWQSENPFYYFFLFSVILDIHSESFLKLKLLNFLKSAVFLK